ncbi:MAG TPA: hypothetical protein VKQ30_06875 [Ktedonobacterales bacterium]|nr:hypothetical protein [Ktedonobacterales bacterium]
MITQHSIAHDTPYDAVIAGSGIAGLLAAHELLRRAPQTRILIADIGLPLEDRERQATSQMGGSGGAGLYLGGRLYLGSSSIPIPPPGTLPAGFRTILESSDYERRAHEVNALLDEYGARAPLRLAPDVAIHTAIADAEAAGLEYITSYPARFLTSEDRRGILRRLMRRLEERGVTFAFNARVTPDGHAGAGFQVRLEQAGGTWEQARSVTARALLLAPGRYGAEWLVETTRRLGAAVEQLPSAFGIRLEVPLTTYAPLTDINPDPRIQLTLSGDAIIKTYATCLGGYVLPVTRYGALVASGVPLPAGQRTGSTTFAVLAQPGVVGAADSWRGGERAARLLNERYPGRLVVQRLADVREGEPTSADALARNTVRPTCADATHGALHDVYPDAFWPACEDFLARLAQLAPGIQTGDALAYGPAEERFWYFPTDDQLQTGAPGLFVAGDGAGQSQGIIQAGVTGILAGAGLAHYLTAPRIRS